MIGGMTRHMLPHLPRVPHLHVNRPSKILKLSLNLSLPHLRAQISCYELKGDLSPVMLKEIFHDSFESFEITRICMEIKPCKRDWMAKVVFSGKHFQLLAAVAIATFDFLIHGRKFSGNLILVRSFSLY